MDRAGFLYGRFLERFGYEPTSCQDALFRSLADFVTCDDADILVVNGYAGTGKTTAVAAAVGVLREMGAPSVLLAPTGRSAKVLSSVSGRPASTIHKHIYRQKSVSAEGCGSFSLAPNTCATGPTAAWCCSATPPSCRPSGSTPRPRSPMRSWTRSAA